MSDNKRYSIGFLASNEGVLFEKTVLACKAGILNADVNVLIANNADAPCIKRAGNQGVPVHLIDTPKGQAERYTDDILRCLEHYRPDLIVITFDRLLGNAFVKKYYGKAVNLHLSLLPAFRGVDPCKNAVLAGVRYAGATMHFIDEGVDSGPIVSQVVVPCPPDMDEQRLFVAYGEVIESFVLNTIDFFVRGGVRLIDKKVFIDGADFESFPASPSIQERFKKR